VRRGAELCAELCAGGDETRVGFETAGSASAVVGVVVSTVPTGFRCCIILR